MKKLLVIILCLLIITGCSEVEDKQQDTTNSNNNEVVEETSKYITIKLNVEGKCQNNDHYTVKVSRYCSNSKVVSFTVENDKDNIFKDLDLNGLEYYDLYGTDCYGSNKEAKMKASALSQIYEIASQHNLNYIPDYRYVTATDDTYDNIREIVLKPIEEFNDNEDVINLNENILVSISTLDYVKYDKSLFSYNKLYKQPQIAATDFNPNLVIKNIDEDTINKIKNLKYYKLESQGASKGVQYLSISKITLFGSPRLYKSSDINIMNTETGYRELYKEDLAYPTAPEHYYLDSEYVGNNIDKHDSITDRKILDEQLCEDYKLTCDRW